MYYLRFLSLALLAGALGSTGCPKSGPPNTDEGERSGSVQPLPGAQPIRYSGSYDGMTTRQRLVVRDAATWTNVWQQSTGTSQYIPPVPPVPPVDFASQVILIAAMGTKGSGGYSIAIDDVRVVDGNTRITVTERSPGNNCLVTMALTAPVAVVAVPSFPGEATFVERAVQHACE
jgi:PrcB C-terminal